MSLFAALYELLLESERNSLACEDRDSLAQLSKLCSLREFLARKLSSLNRVVLLKLGGLSIVRVQVCKWKLEEFMLVRPPHLALGKLLAIGWRGRRVCDFCNEICCRCFGNTIDQDTEEGNFEKDIKANAEAEK